MSSPITGAVPSNIDAAASPAALPDRMTAALQSGYGGPEQLRVAEIAVPRPGKGEVLVRVRASSMNYADGIVLAGRPWLARLAFGMRRPRQPVFGLDFAGEIAAVGGGVTDFAPGDRVYGEADGACAQYIVCPTRKLGRVPAGVDLEVAAAVPIAGVTALHAMRLAGVVAGQRILVNGASGGVGSFAVQIARAIGAEVTGVCSGRNRALVESLGATHVVDYTQADFTDTATRYDAILDLVGSAPVSACRRLLTPRGIYMPSVGRTSWVIKAFAAAAVYRSVKILSAPVRAADLDTLGEMLASGAVRPAIERTWALDEIVDAIRHQRAGRTRGKCVVRID